MPGHCMPGGRGEALINRGRAYLGSAVCDAGHKGQDLNPLTGRAGRPYHARCN